MRCRRGFTLFESLITISLSAMVIAGLLLYFVTLARASIPKSVAGVRVAPSLGVLRDAALLNQVFAQRVAEAKAVYVFGGQHRSIPPTASEAQVRPLSAAVLPNIPTFTSGLPSSTEAFFQRYQSYLGPQEANPDPSDYTVAVVGPSIAPLGTLQLTCLLQVRRSTLVDDGASWIRYDVALLDLSQTSRYSFASSAAQDSGLTLPVGAVHTWYRYQTAVVAEEGPAVVVVPDPHLLAGRLNRANESDPVSRFVYFLE